MLVVSKDNGDTKMLLPIAKEAMRRGHEVNIFAEGVGVAHYAAAGIVPFFADTPNPDPKTSFNWDVIFNYLRPQVVLIGFPGPNNLSWKAGTAANRKGISVVGVEDCWGGVKRNMETLYGLVLTIDEYAAQIVRDTGNCLWGVEVIGNHAIPGGDYESPGLVLGGMREIRKKFEKVFVFGGGRERHTTEELKLLVASLQKTPGNWCLIPRYHPNWKKKPATALKYHERSYEEVWNEMLLPLGDRVVRLDAGSSDDVAIMCDAYFSGLGSSMNTAIASGKPTIAVETPATKMALRESKLEVVPSVYLGGAKVLSQAQDVTPLLVAPSKEIRAKFKPLNPVIAMQKIERYFG